MSSHPDPGSRVSATQAKVQALPSGTLTGLQAGRDAYLRRIDGLVYGENPRNGFFRGNTFYHPDLRFSISFPAGWAVRNMPQAVVGVSQNQDAGMELTLAQGGSSRAAASAFLNQQGIAAGQASQQQVNGVPVVATTFQAQTQQGVVQGLAAFFDHGGQVYQVIGYSPQQRYGAYDSAFRNALGSFAPVTDPAILNVKPNRMDIVQSPRAQTVAQFAQSVSSAVSADELALLNQLPSASATIPAGTLVKVPRSG
jgi:predicted Zn-dependent protease